MASREAFLALQRRYLPSARLLCGQFAIPIERAQEYVTRLAALGIPAIGIDGYYFICEDGEEEPVEVPLGALDSAEPEVAAGLDMVRRAVMDVAPALSSPIRYVAIMPDVPWLDEAFFRLP